MGGGSVFIFLNHLIVNIKWFKKNVLCCRSIDDSFSLTILFTKLNEQTIKHFPVQHIAKVIWRFYGGCFLVDHTVTPSLYTYCG